MFEQLQNYQGNKIVVELVNWRQVAGTVVEVNEQNLRLETDEGTCVIPISAVQVLWENLTHSLTEEDMKFIAHKLGSASDNAPNAPVDSQPTCHQLFSQPCYAPFADPPPRPCFERFGGGPCFQRFGGGPCFERFGRPCFERFGGGPCFERFGRPCFFPFGRPCFERFGRPCFERFGRPCFERFGRPCFERFGRPCFERFGFGAGFQYPGQFDGVPTEQVPAQAPPSAIDEKVENDQGTEE